MFGVQLISLKCFNIVSCFFFYVFVFICNQFGLIDLPSCYCVCLSVCVCVWSLGVVARVADSLNPLKPLERRDALMQMRHACVRRSAAKRLPFNVMKFSICIQIRFDSAFFSY